MTTLESDRRTVLSACGAALTLALAGCQEGVDEDAPPEEQVDQHLDDANAYEGTIEDHTGESEVRVENGDQSTDYAFRPPAIRVDEGTAVVWEWVGGATHTVTHDNGDAFDSGRQSGPGKTFEHTFEAAGVYLYICTPHQAFQRGAVLVE